MRKWKKVYLTLDGAAIECSVMKAYKVNRTAKAAIALNLANGRLRRWNPIKRLTLLKIVRLVMYSTSDLRLSTLFKVSLAGLSGRGLKMLTTVVSGSPSEAIISVKLFCQLFLK